MKITTVFLSTTAILLATSALAADLPTRKEPPAPVPMLAAAPYSWTGFHVGLGGGGAFLQANSSSDSHLYNTATSTGSTSYTARGGERSDLGKFGAFGTIEAGADYQMDRFVVGAFANFDFKNLSAKSTSLSQAGFQRYCTDTCTGGYLGDSYHHVWYNVGSSWDAGLRLGYLVTDRNLIYALGGFSSAQVKSGVRLDLYNSGVLVDSVSASRSGWKSGFVVGAGWETALTDHITFKAEYRYADYGKAASSYSSSTDFYSRYARQSANISVQSVRAVLSYKF